MANRGKSLPFAVPLPMLWAAMYHLSALLRGDHPLEGREVDVLKATLAVLVFEIHRQSAVWGPDPLELLRKFQAFGWGSSEVAVYRMAGEAYCLRGKSQHARVLASVKDPYKPDRRMLRAVFRPDDIRRMGELPFVGVPQTEVVLELVSDAGVFPHVQHLRTVTALLLQLQQFPPPVFPTDEARAEYASAVLATREALATTLQTLEVLP